MGGECIILCTDDVFYNCTLEKMSLSPTTLRTSCELDDLLVWDPSYKAQFPAYGQAYGIKDTDYLVGFEHCIIPVDTHSSFYLEYPPSLFCLTGQCILCPQFHCIDYSEGGIEYRVYTRV